MTQRTRKGKVGLWTKADSVTAFDDLTVAIHYRGGGKHMSSHSKGD